MIIEIPHYLLESVMRHYAALAGAYVGHDNIKAVNARRVAPKEIERVKSLIKTQSNDDTSDKSVSGKESAVAR